MRLRLADLRELKTIPNFFWAWEDHTWNRLDSQADNRGGTFWQDFFLLSQGWLRPFCFRRKGALPRKPRRLQKQDRFFTVVLKRQSDTTELSIDRPANFLTDRSKRLQMRQAQKSSFVFVPVFVERARSRSTSTMAAKGG
jgi:hypothetical protein